MNPSDASKEIVAAFDFDGTLTRCDTLRHFLYFTHGRWRTIKNFIKLSPFFLGYCINFISRQHMKERVLTEFYKGISHAQFMELGRSFARSQKLRKLLISKGMKKLNWHRQQKHRCILISASIDIYLEQWSKDNGFDDLICSKVQVSSSNTITGQLTGENCWGKEKMRRLQELLGARRNYILYAYGDSKGDKELLAAADYPFYRHHPRFGSLG